MASYTRTALTPSPEGLTRKENIEPSQTNEEMNTPGRNKYKRGESQGTFSQQSKSRKSTAKPEEVRNLMPAYINPTHRSSVSDQLISREQVRSALKEDEAKTGHEYRIPLPIIKPWATENNKYEIYYDLGHCLRANIFPGVPIRSCSLVEDSYTADINRRGIMDRNNRQHWHGKKTDDLATWSQILMERFATYKNLENLLKSTHKASIQPKIFVKPSPPLPSLKTPAPSPPRHKKSKKRLIDKSKRKQIKSPAQAEFKKDEDFWDFYDTPIM
ncbi:testis-expressed protein 33 [Xenopus laevis]|nr:testis-expressed protein 33 [Xenopus laevis]XP_018114394.1 testis-expressed protein 33 [Xenopus laevis]